MKYQFHKIPCEFLHRGSFIYTDEWVEKQARQNSRYDEGLARAETRAKIQPLEQAILGKIASCKSELAEARKWAAEAGQAASEFLRGPKDKNDTLPLMTWGDWFAISLNLCAIVGIVVVGGSQVLERIQNSGMASAAVYATDPVAGWIHAGGILAAGTASVSLLYKLLPSRRAQKKAGWVLFAFGMVGFLFTVCVNSVEAFPQGDDTPSLHGGGVAAPHPFIAFFQHEAKYFAMAAAILAEVCFSTLFKFAIMWRLEGRRFSMRQCSKEYRRLSKRSNKQQQKVSKLQIKLGGLETELEQVRKYAGAFMRDLLALVRCRRADFEKEEANKRELERLNKERGEKLKTKHANENAERKRIRDEKEAEEKKIREILRDQLASTQKSQDADLEVSKRQQREEEQLHQDRCEHLRKHGKTKSKFLKFFRKVS